VVADAGLSLNEAITGREFDRLLAKRRREPEFHFHAATVRQFVDGEMADRAASRLEAVVIVSHDVGRMSFGNRAGFAGTTRGSDQRKLFPNKSVKVRIVYLPS